MYLQRIVEVEVFLVLILLESGEEAMYLQKIVEVEVFLVRRVGELVVCCVILIAPILVITVICIFPCSSSMKA